MIASLWSRFYGYILAAVGAIAAFAAVYFKGRSAGKAVEQKKAVQRDLTEAKQHAETIRETSDVEAKIIRLPDADVRERLRQRWTRDN